MQESNSRKNRILQMLQNAGVPPQVMAQHMAKLGMGNAYELQRAIESGDASCCSNSTKEAAQGFAKNNPQLVREMQMVFSGN